jgi:hypothetical protein
VAPVEHELLGAEARLARLLVERGRDVAERGEGRRGWTFTSITPGSGVTENFSRRGSDGRRVALDPNAQIQLRRGFLDGDDESR